MRCNQCGAELERYIERASGPGIVVPVRRYCPKKVRDNASPKSR